MTAATGTQGTQGSADLPAVRKKKVIFSPGGGTIDIGKSIHSRDFGGFPGIEVGFISAPGFFFLIFSSRTGIGNRDRETFNLFLTKPRHMKRFGAQVYTYTDLKRERKKRG